MQWQHSDLYKEIGVMLKDAIAFDLAYGQFLSSISESIE